MASEAKDVGSAIMGALAVAGLERVIRRMWARAVAFGVASAAAEVGADVEFDPENPRMAAMLAGIGDRITGIDNTTRARVQGYIERAVREEMTPAALARLIASDPSGAFSAARAMTIARTETATALARGSVHGWRKSGRVTEVTIYDGADCTWPTGHGGAPLANGRVVTLDEYEANPVAHPNCVRAASAVVRLAPRPSP